MSIKALYTFILLALAFSFTAKGFSQEVLCVHLHDGKAHFESAHTSIPSESDELHVKLSSDFSAKKFQSDPVADVGFCVSLKPSLYYKSGGKSKVPPFPSRVDSPVKTVRLLI